MPKRSDTKNKQRPSVEVTQSTFDPLSLSGSVKILAADFEAESAKIDQEMSEAFEQSATRFRREFLNR